MYPVSDQTARLLLWSEFRWLGLIFEKFTLTYYTNFLGIKIHTPRLLAMLKWFWEDIPQFCIQMLYIFLSTRKPSFVIYISILSSIGCLIISFIAFIIATTSILSNTDMNSLREARVIHNFVPKINQSEQDQV